MKITMQDILDYEPCYDPREKYNLSDDWSFDGSTLELVEYLEKIGVPADDILWLVLHEGFASDKAYRLLAVFVARQALSLIDNPDPRSITAVDVAERYANSSATDGEFTYCKTFPLRLSL